MSGKHRSMIVVLSLGIGLVSAPPSASGQCDPPGQNTKCWDNELGNGRWATPANWDPDGVPVASDNVYHLIGGTITYDVTIPFNQTIASFTCNGGLGAGLTIDDDLPLTITGDMVRNASPNAPYALTVKAQAEVAVTGAIQDIDVTLDTGIPGNQTELSAAGVGGGDWDIPKDTRVDISGNVDAQGATWRVGIPVTWQGASWSSPVTPSAGNGTSSVTT